MTKKHQTNITPAINEKRGNFLSGLAPIYVAVLGALPIFAGAEIIPDTQSGNQPRMTNAANGTPAIDIVNPNARGISHNKFERFNVDNRGVIFNNSTKDGVSQIGGTMMKNANLTNGQARAIIGEVNRCPELKNPGRHGSIWRQSRSDYRQPQWYSG